MGIMQGLDEASRHGHVTGVRSLDVEDGDTDAADADYNARSSLCAIDSWWVRCVGYR
jgi:hypothetical protein